jgi:TonB family protein
MKAISIIFLLLFSYSAFGQSAKKLNQQLRAELLAEQQKQDSFNLVFVQAYQKLDSVKEEMYHKLKQLSEAKKSIGELYHPISEAINTLKILDSNPNMDLNQLNALTDYTDFVKPIKGSLKTKERFDKVLTTDNCEGCKRKAQNLLLTEKLSEYRKKAELNTRGFRTNESARKQLEAFSPRLDSILTGCQLVSEDLLLKKGQLDKEVEVLRENYRVKGPKGFPDAYRIAFPDIHPLPPREDNKNIMYGVLESESWEGNEIGPVQADEIIEAVQEPEIYELVDEPATFPGGYQELKKYLADHIVYPPSAKEQGISGKVFLRFVISKEGQVSNVTVKRGIPDCQECDAEAIRVVKEMTWIPAKNRGKVVNSVFNLPIQFKL